MNRGNGRRMGEYFWSVGKRLSEEEGWGTSSKGERKSKIPLFYKSRIKEGVKTDRVLHRTAFMFFVLFAL